MIMNKFIKVNSKIISTHHVVKISKQYTGESVWSVTLHLSDGSTEELSLFPEELERFISLFSVVEEFNDKSMSL